MCQVLSVSRSAFYRWKSGRESSRSLTLKEHTQLVKAIHKASKGRYGSHKVHAELKSQGIQTSRNRVARIMKKESIRSIVNRKYKVQTTDSNHSNKIADNHLNRNFSPVCVSCSWVSDITYIPTDQGWIYLTTIMDLFDRKVIGWSMSDDMTTKNTVVKAWKMAVINRPTTDGMIFHSDRGVQYTASEFTRLLDARNVTQSMSRKGNCWDNAVAESFFKIIKSELIDHVHYYSRFQARVEIVEFIEIWYNRKRKHASLSYLSPYEFLNQKYFNAA